MGSRQIQNLKYLLVINKLLLFLLSISLCFSAYSQQPTHVQPGEGTLSLTEIKKLKNTDALKIITWNIQNLGRSKSDAEIEQMAQALRYADLVAVQEVVAKDPAGAQAVARLADELNRLGAKWDYQVSHPTRSPSAYISERYAFLWKTAELKMLGRAKLDQELQSAVYREPFIGHFEDKRRQQNFYVINFHARKYNDQPEREIKRMSNYQERLASETVLLVGDFNLTERHTVWNPFYKRGFQAAIKKNPTTLKRKCKNGNYRNHAIDNVFYTSGIKKIKAASIDLVQDCFHLQNIRALSDHLPVFLEFQVN